MLRLERLLQRTEELAALLLVAALALLIGGQIAFRYLFDDPLSWSEELTTFLLISLTFVAATAVLKRGEHFSIDTFLGSLPPAARRLVELGALALQAVVMLALAYYSYNLARLYEGTETVVLGIPEEAKAYVMVYCFLSMALHLAGRLARSLAARASEKPMEGVVFGLLLVVLFIANVPIAVTLMIATIGFILVGGDFPLEIVAQRMWGGVTSSILSAIPMYILAAILMNNMGVTERIFRFALALVGHLRGGLYYVNILASVIFSGMSGSNTADVAGLGKIEIKAMVDANYDRAYSAAVTAASSIIGPIIPPSIILVVYAQLASVSTGRLFLAGILPGLVMAACLSLIVFVLVRKRAAAGDPLPRASAGEILRRARDGIFALIAPAIIVGGMTLGIVTPSEAGVLAVCYSLLLGVVYRSLSFKLLVRSLHESALFSGAILLIIAASGAFGWAVNIMQVPEAVGAAIQAVTDRPWLALLMINVGLLLLGCLEAGSAALVVVAPVLIYLGGLYGIDPVHLGIIAAINLTLGSMTPPVALSLFISARIAEVPMRRAVVASLPFFLALLASLLIVTFVPAFSLALPNWLMGG